MRFETLIRKNRNVSGDRSRRNSKRFYKALQRKKDEEGKGGKMKLKQKSETKTEK